MKYEPGSRIADRREEQEDKNEKYIYANTNTNNKSKTKKRGQREGFFRTSLTYGIYSNLPRTRTSHGYLSSIIRIFSVPPPFLRRTSAVPAPWIFTASVRNILKGSDLSNEKTKRCSWLLDPKSKTKASQKHRNSERKVKIQNTSSF